MDTKIVLLAAAALLAGCASTSSPCGKTGVYMDAQTSPRLTIPQDFQRPPEQRRVVIPDGADVVHTELRGQMLQMPDGSLRCLDRPPRSRGLNF